jgi:glycosyltransferase involved in cell wall biosynthesis
VAWDRGDARRWQRLEYRITARAAATVVCSDLDRQRLGGATVRVVPNVYEPARSPAPVSAASPPSAPVLLFVGFLGYEPNLDAARWFAEAVLPLVRQRRPDTQLLVVGRFESPAAVAGLRAADGVTVTGEVADLAPVLAGARAAVVPIRFGGGTRVKILEAFAAGLPVVTTSVGAEGLSVRDGEQLLVADDPRGFAEACLRLLADPALAAGVAGRGRAFWEQHHRPDALGSAVGQVLDAVLP